MSSARSPIPFDARACAPPSRRVVQRADGVSTLVGLVAAGVGVTRLARSSAGIRRTGVVFVPLVGDHAETVVAWLPGNDGLAHGNLLDLAAAGDLTSWG